MARRESRQPLRRSRRLAGLDPTSNSPVITSESFIAASTTADWLGAFSTPGTGFQATASVADDTIPSTSRADHVRMQMLGRRSSEPSAEGVNSSMTQVGSRQYSSSSTNSPTRVDPGSHDGSVASSDTSSSTTGEDRSAVGQGAHGRRGVAAIHRRSGHASLLRTYTEHLGAVPVQGESFCRCPQQGQSRDLHCTCGEEDQMFDWTWDRASKSAAAEVMENERDVRFHINYSSGTAAVRGKEAMIDGQYFWEVKMTTPVYGTDMMVGLGTAKVDVDAYRYNFCSILGRDSESWGLSYYGKAQEAGVFTNIAGARFGQGSIIGVHLDAWLGRVYFYKNRRPLGVVFTGLRGKAVYPMISSTAARTGMKLIKACSCTTTLQFLCCCVMRKMVPQHLDVLSALQLPPGLHDFLINNVGWLLRPVDHMTCDTRSLIARSRRRTDGEDEGTQSEDGASVAKRARILAELAHFEDDLSSTDSDDDDDDLYSVQTNDSSTLPTTVGTSPRK